MNAEINRRIAKFEKVSFEQFEKDWHKAFDDSLTFFDDVDKNDEDFKKLTKECIKMCYDDIKLPKRSTKFSAGYDFFLPFNLTLDVGDSISIPTGIRCAMDDDWVLQIYPRSGHGFKYGVHLSNTVGIVDSDYFFADNEGHIHVKLTNDSSLAKEIHLECDTAFCQGIFLPFGITIDDDAEGERKGGFGSTDKK